MMIRKLVVSAACALTLAGGSLFVSGPAFAAANDMSPPEPYTAPDPVYKDHKVVSSVDMTQPKSGVSLTSNGSPDASPR